MRKIDQRGVDFPGPLLGACQLDQRRGIARLGSVRFLKELAGAQKPARLELARTKRHPVGAPRRTFA